MGDGNVQPCVTTKCHPPGLQADSFALGVLMMTLLTLDFDLARPGQDEHVSLACAKTSTMRSN